jgi:hypothetical protein
MPILPTLLQTSLKRYDSSAGWNAFDDFFARMSPPTFLLSLIPNNQRSFNFEAEKAACYWGIICEQDIMLSATSCTLVHPTNFIALRVVSFTYIHKQCDL